MECGFAQQWYILKLPVISLLILAIVGWLVMAMDTTMFEVSLKNC